MNQKLPKPLIVGMLSALFTGLVTLLVVKKKSNKSNFVKRAPQLDLNNPGVQDNFPKAPAASEIG